MRLNRRLVLAGIAALAATPARALNNAQAEALIDTVVREINSVINSGKAEAAMLRDFEAIFARYADVPIIARSTLGPDARRASAAQLDAFGRAFQGYISRKYGKRFREFVGGQVSVVGTRQVQQYFEVETVATLQGYAPFTVVFRVSDRSGRDLFFDMVIEGISLGKAERTEIGAMLDRRRGDIDALIADVGSAG